MLFGLHRGLFEFIFEQVAANLNATEAQGSIQPDIRLWCEFHLLQMVGVRLLTSFIQTILALIGMVMTFNSKFKA